MHKAIYIKKEAIIRLILLMLLFYTKATIKELATSK